ncbi:hypothetical protein D8T51_24080, partial [Vibrio vulnificus]
MTPNSLRSFAAGLLAAAILTGSVYLFGPSEAKSTEKPSDKEQKAEKLSDEEMIDLLASKGYVINTEDEWSKQLAAAAKSTEKKEDKEEKKTDDKTGEKVVYRTILTVSMGMTSIDVGNALEKAH